MLWAWLRWTLVQPCSSKAAKHLRLGICLFLTNCYDIRFAKFGRRSYFLCYSFLIHKLLFLRPNKRQCQRPHVEAFAWEPNSAHDVSKFDSPVLALRLFLRIYRIPIQSCFSLTSSRPLWHDNPRGKSNIRTFQQIQRLWVNYEYSAKIHF